MTRSDVIAAIATPPGRGGIGVVRVSGRNLQSLALKVAGCVPEPRRASLTRFRDENDRVIDQGIALYFPAPQSYTGEEVLELQGHGGPAVMNLLLASCLSAGARLAQPGEFTLRAFLNNKLDLAQAESVADLIDASTEEAARCAIRSLQGEFSNAIHTSVQALTDLRMLVEAALDFSEEEIEFISGRELEFRLEHIRQQLEQVFSAARQGSLLREGIWIALVGQPNVGKSSLLNRLAGEEVALVTEVPGTTRDVIRQVIEIEGVPMHLLDTAGLRETEDAIEKMGMARTRSTIDKASIVLLLVDSRVGITPEDQAILASLPPGLRLIVVHNKTDLLESPPNSTVSTATATADIWVSAKTGAGIGSLQQGLLEMIGWQPSTGEGAFMARQRHLSALTAARTHLEAACALANSLDQVELFAEELRLAQLALSSITGEFSADDLLGEIFSRFCIGK
ncbi:tRNA uridine-5-carboxymethylaminomethyl(34) synthesis GTPase MnmE [Nitrosospira multiformis]|uniref:tRNA uridine-5-carboxymethylaminomethyl(34) synthesis GTPase MnmE n=1 Tax=Nitrosospira multiformis TaxID=1231 RepID=UPI00089AD968|nr:tRNA uridine-5-carboxymethylaminomethyl(34) synthesis GTPase MnmE [Nitrosospira multiformis]SEA66687.1 tRNA modification GTPase trmE [Nitrosospira multiformis]